VKTCIINFAKGAWYPTGQDRLRRTLCETGFKGDLLFWNAESELGCPPHETMPYAFKIYAFNEAMKRGYELILWCDAAVWAHRSIDPLLDHIKKEGHVFFQAGFDCAQWTSDSCLTAMGVTRDSAEKMPMYMACCMGVCLSNPRSVRFMEELAKNCKRETLFGAWTNHNQEVSTDPRCTGHRHDQSVGSIIASQLGMRQLIGHETFFMYYGNKAGTAFRYGAVNDMSSVPESIVMLSQGM
jgi:hypothetical protein